MKKMVMSLLCGVSIFGCSACRSTIDTTTVPELDLEQFMGKWYEIARFDHSFERGLVGCTADYSIQPDNTVKVVNSGYKNDFNGKFKQSVGKARRPNDAVPGQLEVSFFLWFYSDYNVLYLAPDYEYVLIGSSSDKYLWILSRTAQMEPEAKNKVLTVAKERGYDTDKLIWVSQK
ncbi:MAG: lipocalin family protein [Bacteroidales bacterium]|nr:lipocalin family protein [Bacteroidales bacterium]